MNAIISPTEITDFLQSGEAYPLIQGLNDADLQNLADALTGALTVTRNEICQRDLRGGAK
jgi:hypothetical protein